MRLVFLILLSANTIGLTAAPAFAQPAAGITGSTGVIVSIQVHGNTITADDEIIRESGLSAGATFSEELLAQARERLEATKRFERVDVQKRYASIIDATQILVVIRVDEGPVRIVVDSSPAQLPRVARRGKLNFMFVPLLDAEDGYGLTYGAQVALTASGNTTSRLVFPLTWGGDKRAGAEFQKEFLSPLAPRVKAGAFVQRRTHPFFQSNADRKRVWGRGEWRIFRSVRAGATAAWQRATLADRRDTTRSIGADVVLDTRIDPLLPRNAVYAMAAIERVGFPNSRIIRSELEANGYIGVYRGTVLAVRALRENMSRPAPPYFKSILGGASNLRGFRAGTAIGDTLAVGSAELRIPLTSPLRLAKFGTSVFIDVGTTYDKGQRFRDQKLKRGVGAGVWATAALFRISLMVAHGIGADTRVHFGAGVTF